MICTLDRPVQEVVRRPVKGDIQSVSSAGSAG
jgi:hypothetical protein